MASKRLTLIGRSYCHLCTDMEMALNELKYELDFELVVVDVDADPELVARFDELVPVLVDDHGVELCHYFLDAHKVRESLMSLG